MKISPTVQLASQHLRKLIASVMALLVLVMTPTMGFAQVPEDVVERDGARGQIVMHYPERFENAAQELDEQAIVSLSKLQYRLGIEHFDPIDVWLVSDLDDYFTWNSVPGRAPTWAIGLSLVNRKTVIVRHGLGPNRQIVDIHDTFDHELAHVAIDVARQGRHIPLWLNEGFASHHADEWTLERGEQVVRAAATSSLIPLKDLDQQFPDHAQVTSLAYAQSHHFVRFMAEQYGEDVFGKIISRVSQNDETFSVAFTMVTGDDFEVVEMDWRNNLAENASPISNLADGTVLFFGASLLFLLAWAKRRRRSKEKFERLDDGLEGWEYDPTRYRLPGQVGF